MIHPKTAARNSNEILGGFVQLLRPLNAVMSMIGVFIGYSLAYGGFHFDISLVYALLSVFFISGGGQAINDYFDYEIDKKRKANRPLVRGLISKKNGLIYSLALFALGIILASFLTETAFWIAVFFSILLILYNEDAKSSDFETSPCITITFFGLGFIFLKKAISSFLPA